MSKKEPKNPKMNMFDNTFTVLYENLFLSLVMQSVAIAQNGEKAEEVQYETIVEQLRNKKIGFQTVQ
jgi:hypothetical protein